MKESFLCMHSLWKIIICYSAAILVHKRKQYYLLLYKIQMQTLFETCLGMFLTLLKILQK